MGRKPPAVGTKAGGATAPSPPDQGRETRAPDQPRDQAASTRAGRRGEAPSPPGAPPPRIRPAGRCCVRRCPGCRPRCPCRGVTNARSNGDGQAGIASALRLALRTPGEEPGLVWPSPVTNWLEQAAGRVCCETPAPGGVAGARRDGADDLQPGGPVFLSPRQTTRAVPSRWVSVRRQAHQLLLPAGEDAAGELLAPGDRGGPSAAGPTSAGNARPRAASKMLGRRRVVRGSGRRAYPHLRRLSAMGLTMAQSMATARQAVVVEQPGSEKWVGMTVPSRRGSLLARAPGGLAVGHHVGSHEVGACLRPPSFSRLSASWRAFGVGAARIRSDGCRLARLAALSQAVRQYWALISASCCSSRTNSCRCGRGRRRSAARWVAHPEAAAEGLGVVPFGRPFSAPPKNSAKLALGRIPADVGVLAAHQVHVSRTAGRRGRAGRACRADRRAHPGARSCRRDLLPRPAFLTEDEGGDVAVVGEAGRVVATLPQASGQGGAPATRRWLSGNLGRGPRSRTSISSSSSGPGGTRRISSQVRAHRMPLSRSTWRRPAAIMGHLRLPGCVSVARCCIVDDALLPRHQGLSDADDLAPDAGRPGPSR